MAVIQRHNGELSRLLQVYGRLAEVTDCVDDEDYQTLCQVSEQMKSEKNRLDSFTNWPEWTSQSPGVLAEAGFYYTGVSDRVRCPFCHGVLKKWNPCDIPTEEHRLHFPYCRFARGEIVGNVPISRDRETTTLPSGTPQANTDCTDLTKEENRLSTFVTWPLNMSQKPESLARAGFYHIPCEARPDRVKCAYCHGKLYNWNVGDDPWIEHARCLPKCPYIRMCVGEDVVQELEARTSDSRQESTPGRHASPILGPEGQRSSEAAEALLEMGFPKDRVMEVIDQFTKDGKNISAVEIANVVLEMNGLEIAREQEPSQPIQNARDERTTFTAEVELQNPSSDDVARGIRNENSRLKENYLCKICMENQVRVTFLPCGHLACCGPCSMAVDICPVCRARINGCVRTYF